MIRLIYPTLPTDLAATIATRMGVFVSSRVVSSGKRDTSPVRAGPSGPHLPLRDDIGHRLQQVVKLLMGVPRGLSGHIDFF
jgi:hypothetical protein